MRILRTIVLFCSMMPRFWATARCAEMEAQWLKEQDAWAAEQDCAHTPVDFVDVDEWFAPIDADIDGTE